MRRWWQKMLAVWPFSRQQDESKDAAAAVEAANRSHEQAVKDHLAATATRAEAEAWAQQVRDHNAGNRFDSWWAEIFREGRS